MRREDIKKLFPDATDDQIDSIMNANGADINAARAQAKAKAEADQAEIERLKAVEAEAEKVKKQQMTIEEQAKAALAEAEKTKAEFAVKANRVDVEKLFVGAGLKDEEYKDILDGIVGEDLKKSTTIAESFIKVLNSQKEATDKAVRKELLENVTPPATGGTGGSEVVDKKAFLAMSLEQKQAYMTENPNWKTDLK